MRGIADLLPHAVLLKRCIVDFVKVFSVHNAVMEEGLPWFTLCESAEREFEIAQAMLHFQRMPKLGKCDGCFCPNVHLFHVTPKIDCNWILNA